MPHPEDLQIWCKKRLKQYEVKFPCETKCETKEWSERVRARERSPAPLLLRERGAIFPCRRRRVCLNSCASRTRCERATRQVCERESNSFDKERGTPSPPLNTIFCTLFQSSHSRSNKEQSYFLDGFRKRRSIAPYLNKMRIWTTSRERPAQMTFD